MSKRKVSVQNIIDIVTNADNSDPSELSEEEEEESDHNDYEVETAVLANDEQLDTVGPGGQESSDEENDNLPLSTIAGDKNKKHIYRWRKSDVPHIDAKYSGEFSPPPVDKKSPLDYFVMFFPERKIIDHC